jgi:hypothetical protein
VDEVALDGFTALAEALEAVPACSSARMGAYLDFAAARPQLYEAMFSLPSGLTFAAGDHPEPWRAFAALRAAFPTTGDDVGDNTRTEVVWSLLHGLATLEASNRLTPGLRRTRDRGQRHPPAHRRLRDDRGAPGHRCSRGPHPHPTARPRPPHRRPRTRRRAPPPRPLRSVIDVRVVSQVLALAVLRAGLAAG